MSGQMTGIWFEIRLKFHPMVSTCDIMHATCTALVWDGPSVAIDGPSLIESFDFCVSVKLSSTVGLVLHNQA